MKYGLITIHNTQNYGSLLQTISTYKALESLGIDITLLDYTNEVIHERETSVFENNSHSLKAVAKKILWGKDQEAKYQGMKAFLNQNARLSKPYDKSNISLANKEFDAFITGSDIVWGTGITGSDLTYFLAFTDDSKERYSFSSSVGTKWSDQEKQIIQPLLNRYQNLSVREKLAAEWVEELTGKTVKVTCDPTMLWPSQYWNSFVIQGYAPTEKYVLIYAVNPDKRNITDGIRYAKKHGMKAYFINFYNPVKGTKTIRPVTVQQWITLFANAEIVFSASYHGLLFSLYFRKAVFFYNRGETSRMISLSQELGIEDREGTDRNIEADVRINYNFVEDMMDEKRNLSWKYLRQCFSS